MGDPQMMSGPGGGYPDYPDERDMHLGPAYNDSYRESPYHHQDFNPPPPNGRMEDDRYSDRGDAYLPPRHDDSFQGMRPGDLPSHIGQPPDDQDRYSDVPGQRRSYDQGGPPVQYGMEEPRYRGSYDQEGPGYSGPGLDDSDGRYRGSYGHEGVQGQYMGPPADNGAPPLYGDDFNQQGDDYGPPPPPQGEAPRYRGSYQEEPPHLDSYDDTQRKYDGLPPVQSDPFADDPFRDKRSHDGSFSALREDPYNRDPSPYNRGPSPGGGSDIYGDRYYGEYSFGPVGCMAEVLWGLMGFCNLDVCGRSLIFLHFGVFSRNTSWWFFVSTYCSFCVKNFLFHKKVSELIISFHWQSDWLADRHCYCAVRLN